MDAILIIKGIYFSQCSDAGKTYYIINTLYNTINIWCHKSASCLLGLLATGVWILQSNWRNLICLQHGRGVYICFAKIPKAQAVYLYDSILHGILLYCGKRITVFLSLLLHSVTVCLILVYKLKFRWPIRFRLTFLSFSLLPLLCCFHTIKPPLHLAVLVQGSLPPSLAVLRQSIYTDLARIDGGCRHCGVDSMLQDLSTDRHTAWQLQNGASMQPSDLLDFASASCFRFYLWIPYALRILLLC